MHVKSTNLAIRFLLELCALAALVYWGVTTGDGILLKLILGLGAPVIAALVWGTFVAPKARIVAPMPIRLAFELCVFGAAVAALFAADRPVWAIALAVVYAVNRLLVAIWGQ